MDLAPPRGDGVDHSGGNVKVDFEHRGFFADQFEASLLFSLAVRVFSPPPPFFFTRRPDLVDLVYVSWGWKHAHGPVTASVSSDQKG